MLLKAHHGVHSDVRTTHSEIEDSFPVHVILSNKLKFITFPNSFVGTIEAAIKTNGYYHTHMYSCYLNSLETQTACK